jgi:hypothetical protein
MGTPQQAALKTTPRNGARNGPATRGFATPATARNWPATAPQLARNAGVPIDPQHPQRASIGARGVAGGGVPKSGVGDVTDRDLDAADEQAAREAEPLLPAPGTPERERMDMAHRKMVAGLLAGFRQSRGSG